MSSLRHLVKSCMPFLSSPCTSATYLVWVRTPLSKFNEDEVINVVLYGLGVFDITTYPLTKQLTRNINTRFYNLAEYLKSCRYTHEHRNMHKTPCSKLMLLIAPIYPIHLTYTRCCYISMITEYS